MIKKGNPFHTNIAHGTLNTAICVKTAVQTGLFMTIKVRGY